MHRRVWKHISCISAFFFSLLSAIIAHESVRLSLPDLMPHLALWSILLILALSAGWSAAKANRKGDKGIQNLFLFIGIGVFIYQVMNSSIEIALNSLLSWLLIALSSALTDRRTLYFVLISTFCLILYSASVSKHSLFLILIVIYVISALLTLVIVNYSNTMRAALNQNKRTRRHIPILTAGLMVIVPIICLTSLLYLLVPRPAAIHFGFFPAGGDSFYHDAIWKKHADNNSSGDDVSEHGDREDQSSTTVYNQQNSDSGTDPSVNRPDNFSLNDSLRPEIDENSDNQGIVNDIVLYMQGPRPQYLRGVIYDHFDGVSWHISDPETTIHSLQNGTLDLKPYHPDTALNQYTITTRQGLSQKNLIVIPAQSVQIRFPASVIAEDDYNTLYAPKAIRPNTIYSVHVPANIQPGRPYIAQEARPYQSEYLQLPSTVTTRMNDLADQLAAGHNSDFNIALAMEKHFRSQYKYSLKTITSQNNIPLDEFLFESRYGHCEYFATAMAVLLRTQKIPSRLVTGYAVTTYNPITGYYEARVLDGHAWVEAWIPKRGWVTFEPTAAYSLPSEHTAPDPATALQNYYQRLSESSALVKPGSFETSVYSGLKQLFAVFNQIVHTLWNSIIQINTVMVELITTHAWWLIALACVSFIIYHYAAFQIKKIWSCFKIKRLSNDQPLNLLTQCYAEMEAMLHRYGHPRDPSWTLRQYRREISRAFPELQPNVSLVCNAYNSVRYSSQMPDDITPNTIKSETLEILNHPFQTPVPARKFLEPVFEILGRWQSR